MLMLVLMLVWLSIATWQCPVGFERCANSSQCIRDYLFCDGIENCAIGSDEHASFCGQSITPSVLYTQLQRRVTTNK